MTRKKKQLLCEENLRHNEYYGMQDTFDNLYAASKNGEVFTDLMSIVLQRENILLAYRNIKKNTGSKTCGTDKLTIRDIGKCSPDEVVEKVRFIVNGSEHGYRPKPVRRKEIPKPYDPSKTKGYLQSDIVKGDKFADKAIYSITDQGRAYFKELMASYVAGPVPLLFDFNVVITNLNKMDKAEALELVSTLRRSIQSSAESNEGYAWEFADIPLVGRTIFEQQQLLYRALLEWLDHFEGQFLEE